MEIDRALYKEIKEYCDLNGIKVKEYIHGLLKDAFMKDKYGDAPFINKTKRGSKPMAKEEPKIIQEIIPESTTKQADVISQAKEDKKQENEDNSIYLPKSKKRKL